MPHCYSLHALCLPAGLEGKQPGRQLHRWCGVFRGKDGDWLPSCDGAPRCLPTGPVILHTATIKNDLQALANFSMLLASLESHLALRKNTDGQTGLLSKCREFDGSRSESWNLQCWQCWCFLPDSPYFIFSRFISPRSCLFYQSLLALIFFLTKDVSELWFLRVFLPKTGTTSWVFFIVTPYRCSLVNHIHFLPYSSFRFIKKDRPLRWVVSPEDSLRSCWEAGGPGVSLLSCYLWMLRSNGGDEGEQRGVGTVTASSRSSSNYYKAAGPKLDVSTGDLTVGRGCCPLHFVFSPQRLLLCAINT